MNYRVPAFSIMCSPVIVTITEFLVDIGLQVRASAIHEHTFLPGIHVKDGVMNIDEGRLLYPGDLLHEAGHLAMLLPSERPQAGGKMGHDGGAEMAALAWSYAAALHLGLTPEVVFHEAGYRGESQALRENFAAGRYVGVPMLEWAGLTATGKHAEALGVQPYPAMRRWLREERQEAHEP